MANRTSVLFVPSATERAAATRYRVGLWIPILEAGGVRCGIYPAISDKTTRLMLESPTMGRWRRLAYYARLVLEQLWRALGLLAVVPRYQIVFLQRTTFPFGLERLVARLAKAMIFDFDDAIYMADPGDGETGWLWRFKSRYKAASVSRTLRASSAAIAENGVLADYARRYCADVIQIAGPVDTEALPSKPTYQDGPPVIGWIGSPSTAAYLPELEEALIEIQRRFPGTRVRLVGAGTSPFKRLQPEIVPWRLDEEVRELHNFDIGVMPMPQNDWTEGKLGAKLVLYMTAGIPAVASYTRTNASVVSDGEDAFLARDTQQWVDILARLAAEPALRLRVGKAGRRTAEENFSVKAGAPKLLSLIERLSSDAVHDRVRATRKSAAS